MALLATTGVCYGMKCDNLPSGQQVVDIYKKNYIQRMRLYAPNEDVLEALRGTDIELMLGVPNEEVKNLADSQDEATNWVNKYVAKYSNDVDKNKSNDVKFRYIAVGNEIIPESIEQYGESLFPAMTNVYNAIITAGLGNQIKVSTSVGTQVLSDEGWNLPSSGAFKNTQSFKYYFNPIIHFLADNQTPLLVNMYPYSYVNETGGVHSLDFALFTSPGPVIPDNGLDYQNSFDAILDAFYWALEKKGFPMVEVVVSETGWPTIEGKYASIENARKYNNNLIQHVKRGTPKRLGTPIRAYILDVFDENQHDLAWKNHLGIFYLENENQIGLKYVGNFINHV